MKLHQAHHVDESGIRAAQQENIDLRASALAAAQVALRVSHHQAASTSTTPAGARLMQPLNSTMSEFLIECQSVPQLRSSTGSMIHRR